MFELKRRLNVKVSGEIVDIYACYGTNNIKGVVSKLELMHRLLYNPHMETLNPQHSYERGRQLFVQMVRGLAKRKTT